MYKFSNFIDKQLGGSTDARFGIVGLLFGFILFAPPLALYFFDKGGWQMNTTIANVIAIIIVSLWVISILITMYICFRWWRNRNRNNDSKRLDNIENDLKIIKIMIDKLIKNNDYEG